jgi:uncharacterized protein (TIGR03086 family)
MSTTETPAAQAGGIRLLERALAYTSESLSLVTAASLDRPTPCTEWDVGELLTHMNDSLLALHEAIAIGQVNLAPVDEVALGGRPDAQGLVAALRGRGCRMMGAWAVAQGNGPVAVGDAPLSSGIITAAGALEVAVHGWDVAAAHGCRLPIPAPLANELLDLAPLLVTDADRPGRFGAPLLPADAGPGTRLLAFLGREPGWVPTRPRS